MELDPKMVDMTAEQAATIGRNVKAALLHLHVARDMALDAGVDVDGRSDLAKLMRRADMLVQDLDTWAIDNAAHNGARPMEVYKGTEKWCHKPSGVLPYDEKSQGAP
jgi:hypothetical protein